MLVLNTREDGCSGGEQKPAMPQAEQQRPRSLSRKRSQDLLSTDELLAQTARTSSQPALQSKVENGMLPPTPPTRRKAKGRNDIMRSAGSLDVPGSSSRRQTQRLIRASPSVDQLKSAASLPKKDSGSTDLSRGSLPNSSLLSSTSTDMYNTLLSSQLISGLNTQLEQTSLLGSGSGHDHLSMPDVSLEGLWPGSLDQMNRSFLGGTGTPSALGEPAGPQPNLSSLLSDPLLGPRSAPPVQPGAAGATQATDMDLDSEYMAAMSMRPDLAVVYAFMGSLFDQSLAGVDHLSVLRNLSVPDRRYAGLLLRNLTTSLCDPGAAHSFWQALHPEKAAAAAAAAPNGQ